MSASPHPLDRLKLTDRTLQRAQYEAFEFELIEQGVLVRNASHENPSDHEYLVTINDGLPQRCKCLADQHYADVCKHRIAVAIRSGVLELACDIQRVRDHPKWLLFQSYFRTPIQ